MTSIPLFESLQNEMHRRMGCSHIGCFNEGETTAKKAAKKDSPDTVAGGVPSSWSTGLYGFLCEGRKPIDQGTMWLLRNIFKGLRQRRARDAAERSLTALKFDDIRSATMYGGAIDEVERFGRELRDYTDATDREKRIVEQEVLKGFRFATIDDARRCAEVMSMLKRLPPNTPGVGQLIKHIGHAFRTGSDGFSEDGAKGNVFPVALWKDPFGYIWDDPKEHVSGTFGTYKQLGQNVET